MRRAEQGYANWQDGTAQLSARELWLQWFSLNFDMILNRLEFLMINNPVRASIQRRFEGPRLRKMGGRVTGGHALEIGCGRGVGAEIILDQFGASQVDAFDLDPRMIRLAAQRLKNRPVRLAVGDATHLAAEDSTYDAAFDFGIVHHIPDWRKALAEVARVLKPGGRFYAEEALRDLLHQRVCRALFHHPWEDRFDHRGFVDGLEEAGFVVLHTKQIWNRFGWYVAQKKNRAKLNGGAGPSASVPDR